MSTLGNVWTMLVETAVDLVKQAEEKGWTGPDKKAWVVKGIMGIYNIPFMPDSLEYSMWYAMVDFLVDTTVAKTINKNKVK